MGFGLLFYAFSQTIREDYRRVVTKGDSTRPLFSTTLEIFKNSEKTNKPDGATRETDDKGNQLIENDVANFDPGKLCKY